MTDLKHAGCWPLGMIWFCCLILSYVPLSAQTEDSSLSARKEVQSLFSGVIYQMPDARIEGNPWLLPRYAQGKLTWLSHELASDYLRYDLVLDQLIVLTRGGGQEHLLALSPHHVSSFLIGQRIFRNGAFLPGEEVPEPLKAGYHELIYQGDSILLVCVHQKKVLSENSSASISYRYDYKRLTYLYRSGEYHRIDGQRSLIQALGSHKNAIKDFLRRESISVKQSDPYALIPAITFYEHLSPEP